MDAYNKFWKSSSYFFFFWMFNINIRCNSVSGVCVLQKVFVSKYMFCSGNYPPCTVIQA